jgi:hypothetical protein
MATVRTVVAQPEVGGAGGALARGRGLAYDADPGHVGHLFRSRRPPLPGSPQMVALPLCPFAKENGAR